MLVFFVSVIGCWGLCRLFVMFFMVFMISSMVVFVVFFRNNLIIFGGVRGGISGIVSGRWRGGFFGFVRSFFDFGYFVLLGDGIWGNIC